MPFGAGITDGSMAVVVLLVVMVEESDEVDEGPVVIAADGKIVLGYEDDDEV